MLSTDTFYLPTLIDATHPLSLSPPSSPTPLPNSPTPPLLMPMMSQFFISSPVPTLLHANSWTSRSKNLHLPITLCKGKRFCTLHPISHLVSYDNLHPTYRAFSFSLTTDSIPKSRLEAIKLPHWNVVMDLE